MILLTREERDEAYDRLPNNATVGEQRAALCKAQLEKTLISVGKESTRLDGTIYLVPDYVEYRKALKEVGLE